MRKFKIYTSFGTELVDAEYIQDEDGMLHLIKGKQDVAVFKDWYYWSEVEPRVESINSACF